MNWMSNFWLDYEEHESDFDKIDESMDYNEVTDMVVVDLSVVDDPEVAAYFVV